MEVEPMYRQNERGAVPEGWDTLQLSSVISVQHGFAFSGELFADAGENPLLTPGHFHEEGGFREVGDRQKYFRGEVPYDYVLRRGDLIVAMTEQAEGLLGSAAFVPADGYLHNQRIGRVRMVSDRLDLAFLCFVFNSSDFRAAVRSTATGMKVKHTSPSRLQAIAVPVPPKCEQRAISQTLSDVDALLEDLEHLIAKKRDLKQAATQQLLTGQTRLPGFKAAWIARRIADIGTPRSERNVEGRRLPVLTCSKHLGFVDSLGFFKNQVFSSDLAGYKVIRRGEIGYPANHIEEGSIGLQDRYDTALVSPIYVVFGVAESASSYFVHRLLKLDSFRQQFKTATAASVDRRGSLRWPAFSEISVRMPALDEQCAIAAVLSDMEAEAAALAARREKTRALKQAMMQELLTGRIRLV